MKNIIYLFSLLFCVGFNNCSAQNPSYHRPDSNADKFAGTWKWGDNQDSITFIMKKENNVKIIEDNNDLFDIIVGFHKIYKNGLVTEDTTMYSNTNFNDKKRSIKAITEDGNPNSLIIFMPHKNKNITIKILYIDSLHIKIINIENQEGARFIKSGQNPTDWSIDIPNNIILTKQ
ncbi:DUF6705 family protein [Chryseobacterium indoltheticum]|uniref:DUF6705 family protein n=1 Tax=Chryseobacterium indoltheticum TaxID=254 RepID=UPI001913C140|nr:DUF6705 family protein [Chryseobacterium indoltheticum]QQQ30015.1 hypothetical protein JJL46_08430 [Chryseobacterium indoltheticum]